MAHHHPTIRPSSHPLGPPSNAQKDVPPFQLRALPVITLRQSHGSPGSIINFLAARGVLLHLLALQRYGLVGAGGAGGLGLHPRLDLRRHGEEGLLDVGRGLGRGLEELNAERVGELLALLGGDDALRGQVGLVADQELVDVLASVPVDLVQPLLHVVEGLVVGDVVDDDDAVGSAVVGRGNGAEALLPRGVPNLELDGLAVELDGADLEVDPDGGDVRLGVGVVGKSEEEARLSDAGISDEQELEQVIAVEGGGGGEEEGRGRDVSPSPSWGGAIAVPALRGKNWGGAKKKPVASNFRLPGKVG